jgi:hypothetical protein
VGVGVGEGVGGGGAGIGAAPCWLTSNRCPETISEAERLDAAFGATSRRSEAGPLPTPGRTVTQGTSVEALQPQSG